MVQDGVKRFHELARRGGFSIRIDKRVYSWYEQDVSGRGEDTFPL